MRHFLGYYRAKSRDQSLPESERKVFEKEVIRQNKEKRDSKKRKIVIKQKNQPVKKEVKLPEKMAKYFVS